jgi:hypothetical protein
MMKEDNRGAEVKEILNNLRSGRQHDVDDANDNLSRVKIDNIVMASAMRRGMRWDDGGNNGALPPLLVHYRHKDADNYVDAPTTLARRPWRRVALVVVASLLAFFTLIAVGSGIGRAISGGGGGGGGIDHPRRRCCRRG